MYFNCGLITLQYCFGFAIYHHESAMGVHPEPPSHFPPPYTIPLGHPSAPAPSILYPALNLDWQFVFFFSFYYYYFFYFTILYWFWHTSTYICHGWTRVPHPEPPSHLPPHTIPLGHPSAPAPSFLYPALSLDW